MLKNLRMRIYGEGEYFFLLKHRFAEKALPFSSTHDNYDMAIGWKRAMLDMDS